ncbi:MAG: alanine racemase, partial [Verrucomicrobiota bacterium]
MSEWFHVANAGEIASPALLLYPDRIRENLRRMIRLAGGTTRLRPHLKTHKLVAVARQQLAAGARGFTCAKLG